MKRNCCFLLTVLVICVTAFGMKKAVLVGAAAKPEVVLTSYSVEEDFVLGEETFVNVTFMNMSEELNCSYVLVSYSSANQSVVPAIGYSNQIFLGHLKAGQDETIQIPIVIYDRGDGYATMTFNVEYAVGTVAESIAANITADITNMIPDAVTDETPQSITNAISDYISEHLAESLDDRIAEFHPDDVRLYSNAAYVVFPIVDESVSVRNVNVTTETTVGANSLVSVSFENKYKTELTDAKLIISGDVEKGQVECQIGKVNAKATKYAEYYLNFSSVGQKSVKLQLVYTSEKGEEITKDIGEYTISVNAGTSQVNGDISLNEEENQNQTGRVMNLALIFFVLGGVVLLAAVIVLIFVRIRKSE